MKFWFDTEFLEDGRTIQLISIGVVAEDGRTYYAETEVARVLADSTDWLRHNVLPHLRGGMSEKPREYISREIVEFMGQAPEIWAYYADYDWVALCQLYGTMMDLPKGWPMYCRDLKQLVDRCGNPKLPEQATAEHNALADAMWAKDTWLWLRERQRAIDAARLTPPGQQEEEMLKLTPEQKRMAGSFMDRLDQKCVERGREILRRPPICEGCGKNRSDPPSDLCVGCQAYRDHQT